jgi:hypothetical protein
MCINKRLGTEIEAGSDIDTALAATGLNFDVKMVAGVNAIDEDGTVFVSSREQSCCRLDTNQILGVHKSRYRPLQNRELFEIGWSSPDAFTPVSAFGFDEGRRPTLFMDGKEMEFSNGDKTITRMTLQNSHDGSCRLLATPTVYRVENDILIPLRFQHGKTGRSYAIRHDGSMQDKLAAMKQAIVEYHKDTNTWFDNISLLQKKNLTRDQLIAFWGEIYSKLFKTPVTQEEKDKAAETIRTWEITFAKDSTADVANPDLWTASAAVAKEIQHADPLRRRGDWETKRAEKNVTGETADKTASIFQTAMAWLT